MELRFARGSALRAEAMEYLICERAPYHVSYEEAELMRRRAEAFLRNAKRLIKEGEWDLDVFNLEQYCQLILKYKLLIKRGSYPRTHSLRSLIRSLGQPEILKLIGG